MFIVAASEDASQTQSEEFEAEVSIGTEIPDQEQVDEYQGQDMLFETNQRMQDDSSTSSVRFYAQNDSGKPRFLVLRCLKSMLRTMVLNCGLQLHPQYC